MFIWDERFGTVQVTASKPFPSTPLASGPDLPPLRRHRHLLHRHGRVGGGVGDRGWRTQLIAFLDRFTRWLKKTDLMGSVYTKYKDIVIVYPSTTSHVDRKDFKFFLRESASILLILATQNSRCRGQPWWCQYQFSCRSSCIPN